MLRFREKNYAFNEPKVKEKIIGYYSNKEKMLRNEEHVNNFFLNSFKSYFQNSVQSLVKYGPKLWSVLKITF